MPRPVRLPQDTALVIIGPVDGLDAGAAESLAALLTAWRTADMPRVRVTMAKDETLGDEPVIGRTGPCAFEGTSLDERLTIAGITTLVFCGSDRDGALAASLREAVELGYRVVLAHDACNLAAPENHAAHARLAACADILAGLALFAARKRPWPTTPARSL
jgi:hypothetical protein